MTTTPEKTTDRGRRPVTLTIDDVEVSVAKGTLVIRAAEQIGVQIPRFCDHPLLEPVGACRQCLVEIPDAGNGRRIPKPQASCTLPVAEGMVVRTQATIAGRRQGPAGNHGVPADQPPARLPGLRQGRRVPPAEPGDDQRPRRDPLRGDGVKRTFPKPINISAQVLLDRERCVLCARCTRFSEQIAGDPFIALIERGALQQVGIYETRAVRVLLLRQHHPDLPGRRAHLRRLPLPLAALRPRLHPGVSPSTAPAAPRSASTTAAAR